MKFSKATLPLVLSSLAAASPTPTLQERSTEICGQWDTVATGTYIVYQDLWGEAAATSGSQCTTVDSDSSAGVLVWSTAWTWVGGSSSVKSYANVVVTSSTAYKQISAISTIESTWKWSYTGTSIVADVSYDIFTSATSGGANAYEIMIWLAAIGGAGPISSTGSAIATVTIDSVSFNLYSGPNGDTTVYSFVAVTEATSFSGDLMNFLTYLEENESFSSSQYLASIGAGTEPFTGTDAVFSTSAFSIVVD